MSTEQEKIDAQAIAMYHSEITNRHLIGPEELRKLFEWKKLAQETAREIIKLKDDLFAVDKKYKMTFIPVRQEDDHAKTNKGN